MVSAKFHVIGEDGDWFRVRVQEEVYAHGLEGSVLKAAAKNLVVVLEGDGSTIRSMHKDVVEMCPSGIRCTDLVFSLQRPVKNRGGYTPEEMAHAIAELERKMSRIDQNIAKILALLEGGGRPTQQASAEAQPNMEIKDDAVAGFASMFGD